MRKYFVPIVLFTTFMAAQDVSTPKSSVKGEQDVKIPFSTLTFSEPKLGLPLQLPSAMMDGPPSCSADGTAFFQFWTAPPKLDAKEIYSVSAKSEVKKLSLSQMNGLTKITILSFDPGRSAAVLLLHATPGTSSGSFNRGSEGNFYVARFSYDGSFIDYSRLDLGFDPGKIAQLDDKSFLVVGADPGTARPIIAIVNSGGTLLRRLDSQEALPSDEKLQTMLQSINFSGMNPENLPPAMKLSLTISLFRFVHSGTKLLMLEPGASAQIVEFSPGAEVRVVPISLPKDQIADSILSANGKWMVRTYPKGIDSQSNIFEVDPETGSTVRQIRTSGVPATSIACLSDNDFYGLRWVEQKPYLVTATK